MEASRRQLLAGIAAACVAPRASCALPGTVVTPEQFGARGDGTTNDTDAFAAMSARINAVGGGTIVLRPVTYIVGKQQQVEERNGVAFAAADIIHLANCRGPVAIEGNGATLRSASGLLYGRFDPRSRMPLGDPAKLELTHRAIPYFGLIFIEKCSGSIDISNIELDGNLQGLRAGGRSAPNGWQAAGTGIRLSGNKGPERLSQIHTHHHAQDGLMLAAAADRTASTTTDARAAAWSVAATTCFSVAGSSTPGVPG
jgi:hypothetical protein